MGKREVGQLGIIDLIVSILIAELAVISIEELDKSLFTSVVPILTLTFLQVNLAYFSMKMPKFRIFLDGNPSVIIKKGKVNYKEINYYYLTNINNPDELLFCYEDNNDLVEITDKNITTKLLPLFFKASEDYFNNN